MTTAKDLDHVNNLHATVLGKLSALARQGKTDYKALGRRTPSALVRKYGADYFRRIRRGERPSQGRSEFPR